MTKYVEVIALEAGHDGRCYQPAGARFHVPEERLKEENRWFALPDDVPPPAPPPKDKRPPGAGPAKGSAVEAEALPGEARK